MKDVFFHQPRLETRVIDGKQYSVVPVVSFLTRERGLLSRLIRKFPLEYRWNGNFLEGIDDMDPIAAALFKTPDIGIVYFVNDSEPKVPIDKMSIRKGDCAELVYIEKDWQA
jgi:hypothetical protein